MNDNQNSDACIAFGGFVRDRRKTLGKTAREVAVDVGLLPSNYCKLEHGAFQPPSDDKLRSLAKALELPEGEASTHTYYDLAAVARNSVPLDVADVISYEEAIPMMLRTLGCRKLTQNEIKKMMAIVRGKS